MSNTLVSIVIPTYNSEVTIEICLRSIVKQTHSNIEVVVVDSFSSDRTREIAKEFSVKLLLTKNRLLGARYEGFESSKGEYALLLDSDQILEKTTVERGVEMLKKCDMLCLEEHSYRPKTWVQRLFKADRLLVHNLTDQHLDPLEGALLARFFRRGILEKAFRAMPRVIMPVVVAHDHSIIYYEAHRVSKRVRVVPNAVYHLEPASLADLWRKNYRYGKTTRELLRQGYYSNLLRKKFRFRKGTLNIENLRYGISSSLLLALKGVAFQAGYWSNK